MNIKFYWLINFHHMIQSELTYCHLIVRTFSINIKSHNTTVSLTEIFDLAALKKWGLT